MHVVGLLDSDPLPSDLIFMAAVAAYEVKVEKISRMEGVVVCWETSEMFSGRRFCFTHWRMLYYM